MFGKLPRKYQGMELTETFWKATTVVFLVRFLCYFLIPFWPVEGMILAIILDILDYQYFAREGIAMDQYRLMDKPIDYLQYLFMIPLAITTPVWTLYWITLLWRTIGSLFKKYTGWKYTYVIFPNMAEYILLIYFMAERFDWNIEVASYEVLLGLLTFKTIIELYIGFVTNKPELTLTEIMRKLLGMEPLYLKVENKK